MASVTMLSVWCVATFVATSAAGPPHQVDENVVRLYVNYTRSRYVEGLECMPERFTSYKVRAHQKLTVHVISNKSYRDDILHCLWKGKRYFVNDTKDIPGVRSWKLMQLIVVDIGDESGDLKCSIRHEYFQCGVHLSVGDGVDDYVQYSRSFTHLIMRVELTQPSSRVAELRFSENTSLIVNCGFYFTNSDAYQYTMQRTYNNRCDTIFSVDGVAPTTYNQMDLYKESYEDNVISCVARNVTSNATVATELRLKHREERRAVSHDVIPVLLTIVCVPLMCMAGVTGGYYCWRQRGKQTTVATRGSQEYQEIQVAALESAGAGAALAAAAACAGSPDTNDYQELYDVTYEDRLRIEHLQKELQRARGFSKPPPPPPVETIPVREPLSPPSVRQVPPGSAIAPQDLYLLTLDSDGYEIPDELKFVPLPSRSAERT